MTSAERLWETTPLIRSASLSDKTGCEVYLKIEMFQKSGSFKGRGISHFCNQTVNAYLEGDGGAHLDTHGISSKATSVDMNEWPWPVDISGHSKEKLPHLVIASAGNAGLAAASSARILGVKCTIFVPGAQADIVGRFERHNINGNVNVVVGGVNYGAAVVAAKAYAKSLGERAILVPAYDDSLVWQGNSTIIHEVAQQLPNNAAPDAIFCSVGGAGLIAGLMLGCESVGWNDVPLIGVEPFGSACFYHSIQTNRDASSKIPEDATPFQSISTDPFRHLVNGSRGPGEVDVDLKLVQLGHIDSRASSLGVSSPCSGAVAMALRRRGPVHCVTVSDERGMSAAVNFADDHCVIAELGCSIALVPAYNRRLMDHLVSKPRSTERRKVLVFVVCGGSKGSYQDLLSFQAELGSWDASKDEIWVDGVVI